MYEELYAKCTHGLGKSTDKLSIFLSDNQLNCNAVINFIKMNLYPFLWRCFLKPMQLYISKLIGTFLQIYFLRARDNEYNSSNGRRIQSRTSHTSS